MNHNGLLDACCLSLPRTAAVTLNSRYALQSSQIRHTKLIILFRQSIVFGVTMIAEMISNVASIGYTFSQTPPRAVADPCMVGCSSQASKLAEDFHVPFPHSSTSFQTLQLLLASKSTTSFTTPPSTTLVPPVPHHD